MTIKETPSVQIQEEEFGIAAEVRQGDSLSMFLFNLVLEMIIRKSELNRENH